MAPSLPTPDLGQECPLPGSSRVAGTGELADLTRAFDWSRTSVGPIESWPDVLIIAVNLLLASKHPMFLWWGPELIQFYNDGYRPSIRADKHPSALGQRGMDCWPEIWHIIGSQIAGVMERGEPTWNTNALVPINRNGKLEEVYWTYSYSPVRDNDGAIRGTLVVCSDTTEQVLSERRLRTLLSITVEAAPQQAFAGSHPLIPFAQMVMAKLDDNPADIPFAALYLLTEKGIVEGGRTGLSAAIAEASNWPIAEVIRNQTPRLAGDLPQRFGELICRTWPEPVTRAFLLPLRIAGSSLGAALAFGISPRLPFDKQYQTFFQLVGARITSLLQSEVHQLELARAARRFRRLAEADQFGVVIGDLTGKLTYLNRSLLKTLGYSDGEMREGKVRWDDLTPPEYAEADARAVEQLRTLGRCDVYEKTYLAKDGQRIPILIGASVIGGAGDTAEVAAFVTDLTPLKVAQEALRASHDELEKKVAERTAQLEAEVLERQRAENSLRELAAHLLRAQDDERRHMARELHDHAGQTLVALSLNLHELKSAAGEQNPKLATLARDGQQLSDELSKEIRTLSYLLHPPLLDEVGLVSAIRWYVEGFSKRSKIQVELELPENLGRLSKELELVIFRIVQESLTNVHRHSGSLWARIHLTRSPTSVEFEISDRGVGASPEDQSDLTSELTQEGPGGGVGIRGMQERIRQFKGTLRIISGREGTRVIAKLPLKATGSD